MAETTRRDPIKLTGRVLYLSSDASELAAQLAGAPASFEPGLGLVDNLSTDELTPAWACYHYDETIARYCLVGHRSGLVREGAIQSGGFEVVVGGRSFGCGSSREQAPYSLLAAGVRLVVARSFEKIFQQNAQNIGLLTTTDFGILERLLDGEAIPIAEFTRGLDRISASIVAWGGLFAYNHERLILRTLPPAIEPRVRPMTLCERIIAAHAFDGARSGVACVAPGDGLFVRTDVRFSHEYVTPMSAALSRASVGEGAQPKDPDAIYLFRDHLTLLDEVIPEEHVRLGLGEQARSLAVEQERFAHEHGLQLFGEVRRDGRAAGSESICHNMMLDSIALPGQVVIGTDSHTCMAGAVGCLAFGVGATDMAAAWQTADVRVTVPETVRVELHGKLGAGVSAKDLMLHLLSSPFFKQGHGIGKVIEFGGDGLSGLPLDERATLANMSVEAGGFTGLMEPDEQVIAAIAALRGLEPEEVRRLVVRADPGASYADRLDIELSAIEPMVALPGDPRQGVALRALGPVRIDIAYGGSCTGGKRADMDMYAEVLRAGLARGRRVAQGVAFYIQFGSQAVRRHAERMGHVALFEQAGAVLVEPSCGACIGAGPGVSTDAQQVTVSAVNRNYPGRSGPGKVYLASPYVVAASALVGRIVGTHEL